MGPRLRGDDRVGMARSFDHLVGGGRASQNRRPPRPHNKTSANRFAHGVNQLLIFAAQPLAWEKAMIQVAAATTVAETAQTAPCPKCGTTMILAAITPHPIAPRMHRHTFLCAKCNQTKTYMLPAGQPPQ